MSHGIYNDNIGLDEFSPSYKGFHVFRENERRGDGVSVNVRKKLSSEIVPHLTMCYDSYEIIFYKITSNTKTFIVDSCYRPPNSVYNVFLSFIDESLHQINSNNIDIILRGDFNFDLLKVDVNASSRDFFNTMNTYLYSLL